MPRLVAAAARAAPTGPSGANIPNTKTAAWRYAMSIKASAAEPTASRSMSAWQSRSTRRRTVTSGGAVEGAVRAACSGRADMPTTACCPAQPRAPPARHARSRSRERTPAAGRGSAPPPGRRARSTRSGRRSPTRQHRVAGPASPIRWRRRQSLSRSVGDAPGGVCRLSSLLFRVLARSPKCGLTLAVFRGLEAASVRGDLAIWRSRRSVKSQDVVSLLTDSVSSSVQ